jgi:hypothetical protein
MSADLAAVPTAALGAREPGQVAEGAGCMMVRLERVEDGRRSEATVDSEAKARELEQLGYERVRQEGDGHDRGNDGRDAGSR